MKKIAMKDGLKRTIVPATDLTGGVIVFTTDLNHKVPIIAWEIGTYYDEEGDRDYSWDSIAPISAYGTMCRDEEIAILKDGICLDSVGNTYTDIETAIKEVTTYIRLKERANS